MTSRAVALCAAFGLCLTSALAEDRPVHKTAACSTSMIAERFADWQHDRNRFVAREMRKLMLLVECYGVLRETYPGPTRALVSVDYLREMTPALGETQIPETDVWGGPYQYWSDGGNHYLIVSFAADRRPGHDYERLLARPWKEAVAELCVAGKSADDDVVIQDGVVCADE
jgi:hypothetical protein